MYDSSSRFFRVFPFNPTYSSGEVAIRKSLLQKNIKFLSMKIVRCRWFPIMGCAPGVGSLGDEVFDVLGNPARNKIC